VEERRRLQGVFNARAKLDREAYYNNLADEVEVGLRRNNLRPAYRAIKRLSGKKTTTTPAPVNKLDGSQCSSSSELLQRWQEHFELALNFPPADPCPELSDLAEGTPADQNVSDDSPSLDDVLSGHLRMGVLLALMVFLLSYSNVHQTQ
jgi:hypothetical protein